MGVDVTDKNRGLGRYDARTAKIKAIQEGKGLNDVVMVGIDASVYENWNGAYGGPSVQER